MIEIYFGLPGSGKTTVLAQLAYKNRKRYDYIFSNVQLYNANFITESQLLNLGNVSLPPNSLLLIDEAGITFNNRFYKSLPKNLIYYAKMHRHYMIDIVMFSQSYEDMDITFRRLANTFYNTKKIGFFTINRKIRPILHVDQEEKTIIDGYEFYPFFLSLLMLQKPFTFCFRPKYYKYFDSWNREELEIFK